MINCIARTKGSGPLFLVRHLVCMASVHLTCSTRESAQPLGCPGVYCYTYATQLQTDYSEYGAGKWPTKRAVNEGKACNGKAPCVLALCVPFELRGT